MGDLENGIKEKNMDLNVFGNSEIFKKEAENINKKIVEYFKENNENNLIKLFTKYVNDRKNVLFINYYNKTVLDKKTIEFGTFKKMWAILGMTRNVYKDFDDNYEKLREEIIDKKDIFSFYWKYCRKKRNEAIFCCKLFHTVLPKEFPIVDNQILKYFKLAKYDKIISYHMLWLGYDKYITNNANEIENLRKILSEKEYAILRINESSDYRILDIIFWNIANNK
jgi:hypothetical protein